MIQIIYPWVLLTVILPFIMYFILPKAKEENSSALKVPFFNQLLNTFSSNIHNGKQHLSKLKYLAFIIWVLIVISGAGIQWLGKPISLPQSGRDLMLAIDLSGSMATPDMVINGKAEKRIDLVKQVANQFIKQRIGDRIGLILFGSQPYVQTPLTFDRKTVVDMLDDATIGIAGTQTALGDAVGLAIKQLINYPAASKALILLTDGGNNAGLLTPLDAANLAQKEHIRIYTIGLGASQMRVQTIFGPQIVNPSTDLDIDSLKQIAKISGGQFFRAEDGKDLENIYAQINGLEPVKADAVIIRPITPLYPWSLGLALILSFILILMKLTSRQRAGAN